MLPENPLISVIIPTYNAARYLPEAVASVRAQQSYEPLEIIVVDDGSTDETSRLVQSWGDVRYLYQINQGPAAARNAGIQAARGELIDLLDADDLWTPNHLASLLPPLLADPSLGFVWGSTRVIRLREDAAGTHCDLLHESVSSFLMGSALYRKVAFAQAGLFAPHLRLGEDTDWLATAQHTGVASRHVDEQVLIYRRRAGSLTSTGESNIMAVIKRAMDRRRGTLAAA
jgi:glycosyltransferase involved in cell wall biosynthesis